MANRINASNLSDLLLPMRQRGNAPGVYFVRLCQWSPEIKDFLWRYHEAARAKGVIIEGQIGNPDERQLSYLTECWAVRLNRIRRSLPKRCRSGCRA